ncbi:hypothetical protein HZH66_008579 [Vespula vulgaris]|uniref:Uncharacterized protein n=1 Tax=Vespula vulgaris TaxID=7454 RepID=A0A834JWA6_VESVU|nr:hypothetical protein HZH66_008579 [Vespula vulgaris]
MFLLIVGEKTPSPSPSASPPPPVPPRRRRTKKVINAEITGKEIATTTRRVDRKRLPPPPPPSQLPRKNKVNENVDKSQIKTRIIIHDEPTSKFQTGNVDDTSNDILLKSDNSKDNIIREEIYLCRKKTYGDVPKIEFKLDENRKKELLTLHEEEKVVSKKVFNKKDDEVLRPNKSNSNSSSSSGSGSSSNSDSKIDESTEKELLTVLERPKKKLSTLDDRKDDDDEEKNEKKEEEETMIVRSPRYDQMVKKKEYDKYPSLFFTLDDLHDVIITNDSVQSVSSIVDEKKLKKESTKVENEMESFFVGERKGKDLNDFTKDPSFLRDNRIDEDDDDNDDNEICFRVTPTNFPFEKCLDRWKTSLENENAEFHGVDPGNNFIFDDYIDRSSALNVRRSRRSSLCYDIVQSNEITLEHTATKVRFVIESSNSSMPSKVDGGLWNIDSIRNEEADEKEQKREEEEKEEEEEEEEKEEPQQQQQQTVEDNFERNLPTTDNADIFGEIPFGSLILNNVDRKSIEISPQIDNNTVDIKEHFNEEKKTIEEDRFNNISSSDLSLILEDTLTKEQVVPELKIERNLSEGLSREEEVSNKDNDSNKNNNKYKENEDDDNVNYGIKETNKNIFFLDEKSADESHCNSQKRIDTNERRKIFVTQSVRSFMNDSPIDWEDEESDEVSDNNDELLLYKNQYERKINDEPSKVVTDSTRTQILDELKTNTIPSLSDLSKDPVKKIDDDETIIIDKKDIPGIPSVDVRRNTFLETMLSENNRDEENWNSTSRYCEIVGIHPKNDRLIEVDETSEKNNRDNATCRRKTKGCRNSFDDKNIKDVKSDVLSELLVNFPTIKLRSSTTTMKNNNNNNYYYNYNEVEDLVNFKNVESFVTDETNEVKKNLVDEEDDKNDNDKNGRKIITTNQMAVRRIQAEIMESRQLDNDMMKMSKCHVREKCVIETSDSKSNHKGSKDEGTRVIKDIEDLPKNDDGLTDDERRKDNNTIDRLEIICSNNVDESIGYKRRKNNSIDNCAIVREKIPVLITHRNNNDDNDDDDIDDDNDDDDDDDDNDDNDDDDDDNNRAIKTPVVLSNDQSSGQDTLTIIPGSVRNFVKYYEIRRETTAIEYSKINDRMTLVRSNDESSTVSNRIKNFECEERSMPMKRYDDNVDLKKSKIDKKIDEKRTIDTRSVFNNDISYTMIAKKKIVDPSKEIKGIIVDPSSRSSNVFDETRVERINEVSSKIDRMKSSFEFSEKEQEKFENNQEKEEDEEDENNDDYDEDDDDDGFDLSQPPQRRHLSQEVTNRTDYERNSGINRFASNTENNTCFVFYCTV